MANSNKSGQLVLAFIVTIFGCLLIAAAMIVPPLGVIDPTVLAALGELLTFSGALIGIDYKYKAKDREE